MRIKIGNIKYVSEDLVLGTPFDVHRYVERQMEAEMIAKAVEEHLPVVADSPTIIWWDMRNPEHLEVWYPKEHYPDGPPSHILSYRWIVEGTWMADTTRSYLKTLQIAHAYGLGRHHQRPA